MSCSAVMEATRIAYTPYMQTTADTFVSNIQVYPLDFGSTIISTRRVLGSADKIVSRHVK